MNTGDYMRVVVSGQLGDASSTWKNTWTLYCLDASDFNALQNIGAWIVPAFLEFYYAPLNGLISQYCAVTGVELREYGDPSGGYDWNGLYPIGTGGGVPEPNFVTASIQLVRDNYAFKSGRKGIPGLVPGQQGQNGKMTNASKQQWTDNVVGWTGQLNVEAEAAVYSFVLRIVHNPSNIDVVPTAFSRVVAAVCKGYGSQNSRKD